MHSAIVHCLVLVLAADPAPAQRAATPRTDAAPGAARASGARATGTTPARTSTAADARGTGTTVARAPDGPAVVELPPTDIDVARPAAPELTTGTATVVPTAPYVGTAMSLADILATTAGVHVRRMGLPGSFTTVSVRGLGGENVGVALDDVPLTSATLGPVDLASFPAAALERIEVYRGGGPVRFESPLGGVIRLVTAPPSDELEVSAHVGYGSFATRSAHASVAGPLGGWRLLLFGAYQGTRGDFRYYDDRDTLYETADDTIETRRNNADDELFLRAAATHDGPLGSTLRLAASAAGGEQGIAGTGLERASGARAGRREVVARLALEDAELDDGAVRLSLGSDLLSATRSFRDPSHSTPLYAGDSDTTLARAGADARLSYLWTSTQETELDPRVSWDRFDQVDVSSPDGPSVRRERLQLAAGLEHRADLGPVRVVPSVRIDAVRDAGDTVVGPAFETVASPRLGLLWDIRGCELRLNAGRFHRVATTLERFGDGMRVQPSFGLKPERGTSADAAVGCDVPGGVAHGEVAAFATRATGLITYVANGQMSLRAANLGDTDIRGIEASLSATSRYVRGDLGYTLTATRDVSGMPGYDGKSTPGIPRHRLAGALEVGTAGYAVRYEITLASTTYLDRANLRPVAPRVLHDLYARAELGGGFSARLSITNVTDVIAERVPIPGAPGAVGVTRVDFLGYPLPGRAWFLSLVWSHG